MKKKRQKGGGFMSHFRRLLLIMKLTIFLIFSGLMTVSASIYSQATKLTLDLNSVSILNVFKQIESQSEFVFIYKSEVIDLNKKVNVKVEGSTVDVVLDEIFKDSGIKYEIIKKQIILTPDNSIPSKVSGPLKENLQQPQKKNPGSVEGFIKDTATGEVLPFATIFFVGTTNGCLSNDKGFYSLRNIMPGNYKMKITYVSYKDTIVDIHIVDNNVIVKNIELGFASTMAQEVIITTQAYGQIKAINTQIAAQTIKNVVSEQKIRELPDANAAEALSRLPGISIQRSQGEAVAIKIRGVDANTVYVNGMRMTGGLGNISSSMIGSIEVSKAFMPDQDADILGGSVDFKMREAPSGFKKDIWLRTGYNDFTKSFKMQDASILVSNRFFNDKLGVMLSLSYDRKDRGTDVLSTGYQSIGSSANSNMILPVKLTGINLTHTDNLNNRYGLTVFTDYKLKNGRIYYQGFFSTLNSDNDYSQNGYSITSLSYGSSQSKGINNNIMNGIGGEHRLLGAKIDWGVSSSQSKTEMPWVLEFGSSNTGGMSGTSAIDSSTTIKEFLAFAHHDINLTGAESIVRSTRKDFTDELGYKLNIEVPFILGKKLNGYIKIGGKVRNIKRGSDLYQIYSSFRASSYQKLYIDALERLPDYGWTFIPTGDLGLKAFSGAEQSQDFSMLGAKIYYAPDFNKLKYIESVLHDKLMPSLGMDKNDFTNNEQYYAGYLMTGINIGKMITFTPGVRYEKNKYSTKAIWLEENLPYGPLPTQGQIRDTTNGFHNEHFFPMIHLKIKPLNWFDIRLAYTKTVSRPDFGSMSPRYYRTPGFDISKGNVYLRPQSNSNYDIYLSFYTNKLGLFTAGAFYKEMVDQVMSYTVRIIDPKIYGLSPAYKGKNYTTPVNNQWPGYIKGVELDWQTQFSYLPRPFNGITLNANVTFMQSETRYPFYSFTTVNIPTPPYKQTVGKDDLRANKVIGMPDMIGNIALGYELGGFAGRISAYYQSATITNAQATNISTDMDKAALTRIDVQLSQKIKKVEGLALYLNINNLTNNPDRTVLTHYHDHIVSEERYGVSGDIGIRYQF